MIDGNLAMNSQFENMSEKDMQDFEAAHNPSPQKETGEGAGKVLRWVKASERLPKYPGSPQNHILVDGLKADGNFHYSIDDDRCEGEIVFTVLGHGLFADFVITKDKFDHIEFLEEIEAPAGLSLETTAPRKWEKCLCVERPGDHAGCNFPKCDRYNEEAIPYIPSRAEEGEFGILTAGTGKPVNPEELWGKPVPVQQGEVPADVIRWIESELEKLHEMPDNPEYLGKEISMAQWMAMAMYHKMQEEIFVVKEALEESRNDAAVYKEWFEKSQASITSLKDQLSAVQGERDKILFTEWCVINYGSHGPGVIWYDLNKDEDRGYTTEELFKLYTQNH